MTALPVARCDYGDLPIGTCACHHCRPEVETPPYDGLLVVIPGDATTLDQPDASTTRIVRRWFARYPTRCDSCGGRILMDAPIARTSDGDQLCEDCS